MAITSINIPAVFAADSLTKTTATVTAPAIDGIRDAAYIKVLDFTPVISGLVLGQGGVDFPDGDLTGTNNANVAAQGLSAKVYLTWDTNNLYYISECTDNTIQTVANAGMSYLATDNRVYFKSGATIKNIIFINTASGSVALTGGNIAFGVASTIRVSGNQYAYEAKIPWSELGFTRADAENDLRINMAQTSSKSTSVVNSVIFSKYNYFGATNDYFDSVKLIPLEINATGYAPDIDGVKDDLYTKVTEFNPNNAGLVLGQGSVDFPDGDLTGTNNANVNAQGLSAKAYFSWDNDNLYFISECTDNTIQTVAGAGYAYLATDNRLYFKSAGTIKSIVFVNTSTGSVALMGGSIITGIVSAIRISGSSYSYEAKIPWSVLGITKAQAESDFRVNFAQTSSKSNQLVNSVVYSKYNYFGASNDYFDRVKLFRGVKSYGYTPVMDGVRDDSYMKVLDFTPNSAGLVFGQGSIDFPDGDLTGSNNSNVAAQGLSAKAYFTWDSNNLYYLSECTDNSIQTVANTGLSYLATDNKLFIKTGSTIKNINFVNTSNGVVAISGGQAVSGITAKIKIVGNSYTIEAKIPLTEFGTGTLNTSDELKVNLAVTSSKSSTDVNSVIYGAYNWYGATDEYFETVKMIGAPNLFNNYNVSTTRVVTNIPANRRTVNTFKAGLTANTLDIVLKNGAVELTGEQALGTGTTVSITDNGVTNNYTAVILGDNDGNGVINVNDLARVKQHLLKQILLTGLNFTASDISTKGSVSIGDLLTIKKSVLGIADINQNVILN